MRSSVDHLGAQSASIFGDLLGLEVTTWWGNLLGGLWAVLILAAGAYLLVSILQFRKATTSDNVPGQADEAKTHAVWAASALGGLIGFRAIMATVFAVFS